MQLYSEFDLRPHTSFGVPASAETVYALEDSRDLGPLLAESIEPLLPLGGGTNVLIAAKLLRPVLLVRWRGNEVIATNGDEVLVEAAAGEVWDDLVRATLARGEYGLENLSAIPGTVGAAPIQNIGAYGVELEEVFDSLEARRQMTGELRRFSREECRFGYRTSCFKVGERDRWIIQSVRFRLSKRPNVVLRYRALLEALRDRGIEHPTPEELSAAVRAIREAKLPAPAVLGNAGSFFKNPTISAERAAALRAAEPELPSHEAGMGQVKIPAGWLIERLGFKGQRLGRAGCHERQALVLVNCGGATADEILALAERIETAVSERFGISLEREVQVLGGP